MSPEEAVADETFDLDAILRATVAAFDDPVAMLTADATVDLEELVNREVGKAIEAGDVDRIVMLDVVFEEYKTTQLQPDDDDVLKPLFKLDVPPSEGGKGMYQTDAEEAHESIEDNSDGLMAGREREPNWMSNDYRYDTEFDLRRLNPSAFARFKAEFKDLSLTEKRSEFEQAWIGVYSVFTALFETWGTHLFADLVKQVWSTARPRNDGEKAQLFAMLGHHITRKTGEDLEEVYEVIAEILGLTEWLNEAEMEEETDAANCDNGFTFVSRILFPENDWPEVIPMEWPGFDGEKEDVIEAIESTSDKPSETAVFKQAMADALATGLSYGQAISNAWAAWRNTHLSKEAQVVYRQRYEREVETRKAALPEGADREMLREMYIDARREAMRVARCVNNVTSTNAGKIVSLKPSGIVVNGKGDAEFLPWEKAIPLASRLFTETEKVSSFVDAAKNIGGQARVFAVAFESVNKRRAELAA
jgi:hypothetical protein